MATTTTFGWETPDDTDLVKDGALAMRTLGNAIDTSLVDLKGGTTGQVLSKTSNTDMDFTWVTSDDANAIQNAIVDAKGDLITATAADTPARLAVGTDGQVLTADSSTATGLKWAASSSGLPAVIGCALSKTGSDQTISNATSTEITWNNEYFDTDGFHSTSTNTNRITIPTGKGGKYKILATVHYDDVNTTGLRRVLLWKNGSTELITSRRAAQGAYNGHYISWIGDLVAGDYVSLETYQTSGGNTSIFASGMGTVSSFFSATYLGA
jgi:hypothetical protein